MSEVLAIIPARAGSKGIPNKNFRDLCGRSPVERAVDVVLATPGVEPYVSTDKDVAAIAHALVIPRPAELAQDDTPMIDVVKHALSVIPGPPDQIILLVQPTQPLREPKHLKAAIALLRESQADSVVSVVELPRTHSPDWALTIQDGTLWSWLRTWADDPPMSVAYMPSRRQDIEPAFTRDGTVYAFYRDTVERFGHIYGERALPLIIPASETCALDTPEDWAEAERRLAARG